jgi:hypothetical protein
MLESTAQDEVSPMISHRFAFDSFFDAFAMAQDRDRSAKMLVTFPD